MTDEEELINFLNNKYQNSKTNEVTISKNDCITIGMSEEKVSRIIHILQADGMLIIKRKSVHNDFSMCWTIEVNSSCVHYFENKKNDSISNRREWIRTYIPITLSFIALIKSFLPEIILVMEQLSKLLGQILK